MIDFMIDALVQTIFGAIPIALIILMLDSVHTTLVEYIIVCLAYGVFVAAARVFQYRSLNRG